VVDNQARTRR